MARYRKKPVVVEAVQFTGTNWSEMALFVGFHKDSGGQWDIQSFNPIGTYLYGYNHPEASGELWVAANQQWLPIDIGEWVIKDELGYYPCKDEMFQKIYEKAGW